MLPPNLLANQAAAWEIFANHPAGLITDVDGTLSPIVDQPETARLHPAVPELLRRLSTKLALVAVVSGRSISQITHMVGNGGFVLVGNHGLEWKKGDESTFEPGVEAFLPAVASTMRYLRARVDLPGVLIEDKGASGTIHYRAAPDPARAREIILETLATSPTARGLQITEGRRSVNILPPIETNKGTAVFKLAREWKLSSAIYLGDDVTDVDAFRALQRLSRGGNLSTLRVAVLSHEAPLELIAESDYRLDSVEDAVSFLERAASFLEKQAKNLSDIYH